MRLTLSCQHNDSVGPVDVSPDMTLADFKAYVEAETGIEPSQQVLLHNGQPMMEGPGRAETNALSTWQLEENDMIVLIPKNALDQGGFSGGNAASGTNPAVPEAVKTQIEQTRQRVLTDPVMREGIKRQYPELESLVENKDRFAEKMIELETQKRQNENNRQEELRKLQEDPDNPESQQKIMELIQQEAISENMNLALEHNPEVFGSVTMLFINVEVNGQKVKAFVDSGAQTTIMSPECVELTNLSHLIDKRFQGIARGVGEAKIIGKIHSAPIKVGDTFFPTSFTVMEGRGVDLLLGLDMLKRYQGLIDLKNNKLVLGETETSFLPESEIPSQFQSEGETQQGLGLSSDQSSATAQSSNTQQQQPQQGGGRSPHPDEVVSNLMNLGFNRNEAIKALDMANGDPEVAAALLFQGV